jgi:hypothetical protein
MSRYVVRVTIQGEGAKYRQRGRFVDDIEQASRYPHPSAARVGALSSLLKIKPRFHPLFEIVDTRDMSVVFNVGGKGPVR